MFFLFLVVFLITQRTNEIEEGLQQPHNIHIIPGGFEFVATTACITVVCLHYHGKQSSN